METMTESGGVVPHRHHPIPGSSFFPQKETSSPSYFFPSNAGNQSVYRGYNGGSGGQESGESSDEVPGVVIYGGQHKGHERRDSEDRGSRPEVRQGGVGGSGGLVVPPKAGIGGGDRFYLPPSSLPAASSSSSSPSSSQLSHPLQPHSLIQSSSSSSLSLPSTTSSYYHRQQEQSPPQREINPHLQKQFFRQKWLEDENKKILETNHANLEASNSRSDPNLSPDKRSSGKNGIGSIEGEFTPKKGSGVNLPYEANTMVSPFLYNNSSGGMNKHIAGGRHHQTGFINEGRQPMPGFGRNSPQYMTDVRESVKEVYDSFMHGRRGNGKDETVRGMKAPEAIPVAYDDNDTQSHHQQFREKLERSTSQDAAAAMNARNMMAEYNHQLYGGRVGGGDHHRPRAITMNSMHSRRDSPSSIHQSSPYGAGTKDPDLYNKMREHFKKHMKNHYYYEDKDKEGGGVGPMPPIAPTSPYLEKHQRRPSGDGRSITHAQSRSESSLNRMMMLMSPNNQSDHRQPYPPMNHQQQQQHLQQAYHLSHLQQQQRQLSDPDGQQQPTRSTIVPPSHHSPQRKCLDSRFEEQNYHSSKTPAKSDISSRPRSPFGPSPMSAARKSPVVSPSGELSPEKRWPSFASIDTIPSVSNSRHPDKQRTLSGEESLSNSNPDLQGKDEIDAEIVPHPESTPSKGDKKEENPDSDKSHPDGPDNGSGVTDDSAMDTPTSKLDASSDSLGLKDEEDSPNDSRSRKLSTDSPDDTSLPEGLPRELMPKKELLSDGEEDSFHSSTANYPPMSPPSPNSSSRMSSYPPPFHPHPHQQHPQHPHHHHQQQQQQSFFNSPERMPGQIPLPDPFRTQRGLHDGPPPGMAPAFPFNKDSRFPMPGMPREMNMAPNGSPYMGGPMPPLNMGGDKDVYFCHLCSYSGKSKSDFDNHMGIHFEYNCPHCDYTSRTEGRLKRHIKDFHTDENGRRSMPGRPKVFKCKQCSFSATEKDKFWEHARSHIKEDKLLQCPKCPFVTEYKHHLEYHLRNHFGSKPFKCNKCNYSCVNKSMLNSHMKSHTNVYQYRCSDCTYATKYCHSLKLHLRKYNHKPATVLNQDGSLPQGADVDASGLAVNTKRGPPRGPRGPRKDKNDPYFGQMFGGMPPMPMGIPPAMNPMLKGMMPFWPVMPPSGMPGHPGMMSGLPSMPQHMGMRGDNMDARSNSDRGGIDRASDPEMNEMMSGEDSPVKDDDEVMYIPCRLCDFVAEGTEGLCLHLLQAHKDETGELASMYGISEAALAESLERAKKNRLEKSDQIMLRSMSEIASEPEHDMSEYRRRNTIAGLLSRDGSNFGRFGGDKPFWASSFGQREKSNMDDGRIQDLCYVDDGNDDGDNENDSAGGMDILQQMTLKFGGGVGALHAERRKSLDVELIRSAEEEDMEDDETNPLSKLDRKRHGHKESPLDLTKTKSASPMVFNDPSSRRSLDEFNSEDDDMRPMWLESDRGSELDKVTENLVRKRQFSEVEETGASSGNSPAPSQEVSTIVPRKRSRKGKAYKLETLCLKLQERQSKSPHDSDDSDNDFNNSDQYQTPETKITDEKVDDSEKQNRDVVEEKTDDINQQKSIEEQNDERMNVDANCDDVSSDTQNINDGDGNKSVEDKGKEIKDDNEQNHKNETKIVKEEPVESCGENEKKEMSEIVKNDDGVAEDDTRQIVKKEPEEDDADNSFEKLQEALKDLTKGISDDEGSDDVDDKTGIEVSAPSSLLSGEHNNKLEGEKTDESNKIINDNNDDDNKTIDGDVGGDDDDGDDDDDDAKTEILGDDSVIKDDIFDLSDKENSNDGLGSSDNGSSSVDKVCDEVQIEDKVDMINTVLENRKKPLPPAVRRGTELAWKLLNDPVNPVTSIPIPAVSPTPPEWKSPTQQIASPPATSPLGTNVCGMGPAIIPTPQTHASNMMASPLKNGISLRGLTAPSSPFSHGIGLPQSPINLNMKPHLPIPLPPTPMAFIPPTNRMIPEHAMPRPPPLQAPPRPTMPMSKPVPKDMYECTYCDLSFRDCVMYTVHMGYHSNRNPFKCNSCGIICRDKVEFFLHIARSPHS